MSLQVGQIVRYGSSLWRVDMVNDCRARIVPLARRHVVILDGEGNETRSFDAERGGVNISPDSPLPVITDVARAKDEIELQQAEEELRVARALVKREATPVPTPTPPSPVARRPQAPRSTRGWEVGPVQTPPLTAGSQAALVLAYVAAHPGQDTVTVAAALPGVHHMPQCLSRLKLTGYVKKC